MADPDRNGTIRTAQNLGNLTRTLSRRGTIGFRFNQNGRFVRDGNDFLKFRVASSSNVVVRLDQLRQDADIQVYDSSRRSLGLSRLAGTTPDAVDLSGLAPGIYYVRVFPGIARARTAYRLSVILSQDTDSGSFATASNLGNVARFDPTNISGTSPVTPTQITNNIGFTSASGRDTNDYYRFSLSSASDLSVSISGLTADADLEIYDSSFNELGSSIRNQANTDTVNLNNLAAGTYYARVIPFSSSTTNYVLSLISSPPDGVNDNFTDSTILGSGTLTATGLSITNGVGVSPDTNDFYVLNLDSSITSLRATVSGLSDDVDIQVFNGAFQKLAQSRNGGTINDSVTLTGLSPFDTYYIRVYPGIVGSASNYTLSVTPT
ncbi:MAG: PPC domain-containing protein [Oculatellaceae cyanobacterium bins.114]|nr:PPC domain-containing protein [Oculatellaceae cyanobacterium bins.114]